MHVQCVVEYMTIKTQYCSQVDHVDSDKETYLCVYFPNFMQFSCYFQEKVQK